MSKLQIPKDWEGKTPQEIWNKQSEQSVKLTARDFVYVYEPGIGQTYQNCAYLITVTYGPVATAYTAHYRGQKFGWYEDFLSAVEACAKHDAARHNQEAYTQRCERADQGLLPRVSRRNPEAK